MFSSKWTNFKKDIKQRSLLPESLPASCGGHYQHYSYHKPYHHQQFSTRVALTSNTLEAYPPTLVLSTHHSHVSIHCICCLLYSHSSHLAIIMITTTIYNHPSRTFIGLSSHKIIVNRNDGFSCKEQRWRRGL